MAYFIGIIGERSDVAPRGCYKEITTTSTEVIDRNLMIRLPGACIDEAGIIFRQTLCALRRMCFNKIYLPDNNDMIVEALALGWDLSSIVLELGIGNVLRSTVKTTIGGSAVWYPALLNCGILYLGPIYGYWYVDGIATPSSFTDAVGAQRYYDQLKADVDIILKLSTKTHGGLSVPVKEADLRSSLRNVIGEINLLSLAGIRLICKPGKEEICRCLGEAFYHYMYDHTKNIVAAAIERRKKYQDMQKDDPSSVCPGYDLKVLPPVVPEPLYALHVDEPFEKEGLGSTDEIKFILRCFHDKLGAMRNSANQDESSMVNGDEYSTFLAIGSYERSYDNFFDEWAPVCDYMFNNKYEEDEDYLPWSTDDQIDDWGEMYNRPSLRGKIRGHWISLTMDYNEYDALFKYATNQKMRDLFVFPWSDDSGPGRICIGMKPCDCFIRLCSTLCIVAKKYGWPAKKSSSGQSTQYLYCKYYPDCDKCDHNQKCALENDDACDWTPVRPVGFPPISVTIGDTGNGYRPFIITPAGGDSDR